MNEDQCAQLLDKVRQQPSESLESETVEFKHYSSEASIHNAKDLAEEISALANLKGGAIIIGVRDSNNVLNAAWPTQLAGFVKVDLDTTRERLRGKLKPSIDIDLIEVEHELKIYLVISVPRRRDTLVSTASGKVCIRDGKSSRPMTPDEIKLAVKNLQDFDWSAELLELDPATALDDAAANEAYLDFIARRDLADSNRTKFLEAIGATHNGVLTRSGLLFLGKKEIIKEFLNPYEYRFSRKTRDGRLVINDVWEDCLWHTVKRAKTHFDTCNNALPLTWKDKEYRVQLLDKVAFHEAYLNALVHRDYSADGMVSVNFTEDRLVVTSPGSFYGGVTSENIAKHEPRHRNKALARMMMEFHLVDRAGMGVLRMSVNSLRYGRAFPIFSERGATIEVSMQAEYFRAGIFVIATDTPDLGVPELLILNSIYETGSVPVQLLINQLSKTTDKPWPAVQAAISHLPQVEYCGNRKGMHLRVKPAWSELFCVTKPLRVTSASTKHVMLYQYLAQHGSASNADIKAHLKFKSTSQTSAFLRSAAYTKRSGKGPSSVWSLSGGG